MIARRLRSFLSLAGLAVLGYQLGWWLPPIGSDAAQDEVTELLDAIEILGIPDGTGNDVRTLRISGVNLQVVSGQGATNGYPTNPASTNPAQVQTNGAGNLILGYLELSESEDDLRTGSHNLIVGTQHTYTSFGSLVSGRENVASAPFTALLAGRSNEASGDYAAVVGGRENRASDDYAVAAGGRDNEASGPYSVTVGGGGDGLGNLASGAGAVAVGGREGSAEGPSSVVVGGASNRATVDAALVAGGESNHASGVAAALLGGEGRTLSDDHGVLADEGSPDADWSIDEVDGATVLTANAARVGIGESAPSARLDVAAPIDEDVAASFQGDVLVGRGVADPKLDATEHIELRGNLSRWFVGVENVDDKYDAGFFVSTATDAREMFHLTPDGDLGLGTDDPAAALHVARPSTAEVLLEGGDPSEGEHTGVRLRNALSEAALGFYGDQSQLVFGYSPGAGPRVELTADGHVRVEGILDVEGPAIFQETLDTQGSFGVGENLIVQNNAEVKGNLVVHGELQLQGPVPGWEQLQALAFGRVDADGTRVAGSTNWTCSYRALSDDYLITVSPAPAFPTLLLAQHEYGGTVATGIVHPSDPNSGLEDDEFIVRLVKGWPGLPGNQFPFQFTLFEMRP